MTPGNYILGRAKQLGLSLTQLAALLHMTYPTLRQRLLGNADWRAGEIKLLEKLLKFTPAEIYALTVDKPSPRTPPPPPVPPRRPGRKSTMAIPWRMAQSFLRSSQMPDSLHR